MKRFPLVFLIAWGCVVFGQVSVNRRLETTFDDLDKPGRLVLRVKWGNLGVRTHDSDKVIIERLPQQREKREEKEDPRAQGLKPVPAPPLGFTVRKEDDSLIVRPERYGNQRADFVVTVPVDTSLLLRVAVSGSIAVTGVRGEIEAEVFVGPLTLEGVRGPVVATARDGDLTVTLGEPVLTGPMFFASVYGHVDVTLLADTKADLQVKSDHGKIYSGLATTLFPETQETGKNDRYQAAIGDRLVGKLNGGGPLLRFKNSYGNIYLREQPSP